jgi:hypothetical protein
MLKSKIIRYLLIALIFFLFFSIAVIAIIITRGGQLTDDGLVLDTGVIRIQTDPANIKGHYFLNDKEFQVTDGRLNGLLAGVYNLKIESEGYANWEKDVRVTSGIVVDVFAKLYPSKFVMEQLTTSNIDRAFFSANGEFVYYVVKDSEFGSDKGIWRQRLIANQFLFGTSPSTPVKIADISDQLSTAIDSGLYSILPSPDNTRALFMDSKGNKTYLLNAASFNESPFADLNETLGFAPEQLSWFNGSNSLVVKDRTLLFEHNLTSNIDTVIKYSQAEKLVFSVTNSTVYIYDSVLKQLFKYTNQKLEQVKLVNIILPANITELHSPLNNSRFLILKSGEKYSFLDLDKSLIKEIGSGLAFSEFAQDGRSALFIQDNKVFSYTVKEVVATNSVETKLNDLKLTLATANDTAHFVPQSTHVLFYANGDKHIVTVMDKDGTNPLTLLDNPGIKNSDFSFNSDATRFIVLLKDEIDQQNQALPSRANLYAIDLEKPQL